MIVFDDFVNHRALCYTACVQEAEEPPEKLVHFPVCSLANSYILVYLLMYVLAYLGGIRCQ